MGKWTQNGYYATYFSNALIGGDNTEQLILIKFPCITHGHENDLKRYEITFMKRFLGADIHKEYHNLEDAKSDALSELKYRIRNRIDLLQNTLAILSYEK